MILAQVESLLFNLTNAPPLHPGLSSSEKHRLKLRTRQGLSDSLSEAAVSRRYRGTRKDALLLPSSSSARAGMLEDVANVQVPTRDGSRTIQAFLAGGPSVNSPPPASERKRVPVVILLHEFWGLAPEIRAGSYILLRKAEALAEELDCVVIAPDTYRGQSTRFIPKAIFLALTTPQERVNEDLDEVLSWASTLPQADIDNVGIVGFCYGGGKAIRYALHYKKAKAIAVIYGKPVLDVESLKTIQGSILAIYGDQDTQFPLKEVKRFEGALLKAEVKCKVSIYKDQRHAFWRDMDQVRRGDEPQKTAWIELTSFLRTAFDMSCKPGGV